MGKSSRETLATALARLKKLQRKWKKVKVARTMNVVGGEKYYESYLATRDRAKSIAAKLFIDEFAPLASNITESIGLRRVPCLRAGSRYLFASAAVEAVLVERAVTGRVEAAR